MKKHILLVALLVLAGALMFAEGGTGMTYGMIDVYHIGFHSLSHVTKVIDRVDDFDWRNIKDSDTVLVKNLSIYYLARNKPSSLGELLQISMSDKYGHELSSGIYKRFFLFEAYPKGGAGDNGIYPKLEACKDGHWDKKSQSYVGKKTISCYVQVRRDERDDYLEIIAVTIPV